MHHDQIEALLDYALHQAALDPSVLLTEVRFVRTERETIDVQNMEVKTNQRTVDQGIGVRVRVGGAWAYGATNRLTRQDIERVTNQAIQLAHRNAAYVSPFELPALAPQSGTYETPMRRDPFQVSLHEKIALLRAASHAAKFDDIRIAKAASLTLQRRTWLKTSAGTNVDQRIVLSGAGLSATAAGNDDVQTRSYPKSHEGNVLQAGWEAIEDMDLVSAGPLLAEEAKELLFSPPTPRGRRTLILSGTQLSLQIHESCGHPAGLDRALGEEISLAGGSFLQPDRLGRFAYGSKHVHLYADSVTPEGPGTFGWDDEGTPAGRWDLVRGGRFGGYLGSRDTAAQVQGTRPGALRAAGYGVLPIVRMVNVNIAPGEHSLERLIAETEDGVLMSNNKSWSIDDYRLNFQFGCEVGWEIKHGEFTRMLKNPVYSGKTPDFWRSCDAVGDETTWKMWGWMYCGKGDPMQTIHVGHGCPAARFQDIEIGSTT